MLRIYEISEGISLRVSSEREALVNLLKKTKKYNTFLIIYVSTKCLEEIEFLIPIWGLNSSSDVSSIIDEL